MRTCCFPRNSEYRVIRLYSLSGRELKEVGRKENWYDLNEQIILFFGRMKNQWQSIDILT